MMSNVNIFLYCELYKKFHAEALIKQVGKQMNTEPYCKCE